MTPTIQEPFTILRDRYYSHRSGNEDAWRCPRAGYLGQFHLGTGIQKFPRPYYLDTGISVHIGLQQLLIGATPETAVAKATAYFDTCGQDTYLNNFNFTEQRCLIEALLWSFFYFSLTPFLNVYEVLWVEQEIIDRSGVRPTGDTIELIRMSRPDAIVRDRKTGEIVVISWKTIDSLTDWRKTFYRHDLQGLLETAFSELFFAQRKQELYQMLRQPPADDSQMAEHINRLKGLIADFDKLPEKVDYVQTIFLQKGKRKKSNVDNSEMESDSLESAYDSGYISDFDFSFEGDWRQDTFLLYPWCRIDSPEIDNKVPDRPMLSWKWRYKKPGNASFNTLGKAYKPQLISLADPVDGVQQWIRALDEKVVFPSSYMPELEHPLSKVVIWDDPQYRNRNLQTSIVRQTWRTERERVEKYNDIQEYLRNRSDPGTTPYGPDFVALLDDTFEQHLTSCNHPWRCQFQNICFYDGEVPFDWSTLPKGFVNRIPHHDPELEYFKQLGLAPASAESPHENCRP